MQTIENPNLLITFIDACPPPLPDGDYKIQVGQEVTWQNAASPVTFSSTYDFSILGPRFTLDPAEIQSVFPPPNKLGHFQKYLPHMVFARRSLPWERTLDGKTPQKPYYSWLWLLTLSEEEARSMPLQTVRVAAVFDAKDPKIKTPDIKPETGDDPASECMVADMPVDLFQRCVPGLDDLLFLASAREVSVEAKELTPKTEDDFFSVVVANRFSKNGAKNVQYLLSLEGYGSVLYPAPVGGGFQRVRLVALASWSFSNSDDEQTFDELMQNLSVGRIGLPPKTEHSDVRQALAMGYTALDHTTRQGEHTVSWYRGPLLPMYVPKDTPLSYPNSDAAIRYDPLFGLFDVSYAAAMQIGRLLGLQSQSFTTALGRMRSANQANMAQLLQRSALYKSLNGLLPIAPDARVLLERDLFTGAAAAWWAGALAQQIGKLGPPADPTGLRKHIGEMPGLLSEAQIEELFSRSGEDIVQAIRKMLIG
jgi:hypothetical protein